MKRLATYFLFSLLNVLIFSYVSVFLYQTYCLNYESDQLTSFSSSIFSSRQYSIHYFYVILNTILLEVQTSTCLFRLFFYIPQFQILTTKYDYFDFELFNYYNVFELYVFTKTTCVQDSLASLISFFCLHDSV